MWWLTSSLPHREDADFHVGRIGGLEKLVAPFHFIQREGDLLDRFEPDDLGNLLGLHRRQLDEPGEAGLAADADGGHAALDRVPLHEIRQGGLDECFAIVAGVGENVFVLDDFEIVDAQARSPSRRA